MQKKAPASTFQRVAPKDEEKRRRAVLAELAKVYPQADCALVHKNPFELLTATILSAQCTDKRVNLVTPALFKAFPTPQAMAQAPLEALERLVASTGFFRAKSQNMQNTAAMLVHDYGGQVPKTLAQLVKLPGVARKTANVVLGVCFGLSEGVVVDTHVLRLAQRLGFSHFADAKRVEQDLMQTIPRADWITFSHRIILHGRNVCDARKPRCDGCVLRKLCPHGQKLAGLSLA